MKSKLPAVIVAVTALGAISASATPFSLTGTASYSFSAPPGTFLGGGAPSPDTAFVSLFNNGPSTFAGTLGTVAVSQFAGDLSFTSAPFTLGPGDTVVMAIDSESSNVGGFNGPFGSTQPGVQVLVNGTAGGNAISFSIFDRDIHSGVPRLNPFGITLDSYILQGGDPLGRDTGDDFEVTQAPGSFLIAGGGTDVPDAGNTLALLGAALGCVAYLRRRIS
jgi:VPDSG-CTERM motif